MLPGTMLPLRASLASPLAVFGPLFTAPSFRTFCGLACGFLSQAAKLRRVIIVVRFNASRSG
jgi:hypothetical protein